MSATPSSTPATTPRPPIPISDSDLTAAMSTRLRKQIKKAWTKKDAMRYADLLEQAIYFKTGRSKTMNSIHLKRCAIDLNFFKDGKIIWDKATIAPLGVYWESLHAKNRWGGNFSNLVDCPHFERNVG